MRPEPKKERAVVDQGSGIRDQGQTYVLKSGSDFTCLTNDYTQRQSEGAP
jgi:hypothetical protein